MSRGYTPSPFVSLGGEGTTFIGYDSITGKRVVAYCAGVKISTGAKITLGASAGIWAFGFNGSSEEMSGWSLGAALSAGAMKKTGPNSAGISISESGATIKFFGRDNSLLPQISGSAGYTYRLLVRGEEVFFWNH